MGHILGEPTNSPQFFVALFPYLGVEPGNKANFRLTCIDGMWFQCAVSSKLECASVKFSSDCALTMTCTLMEFSSNVLESVFHKLNRY